MAWRRPGDKPLSEPMMVSLLTLICVTRPQWVNTMRIGYACRYSATELCNKLWPYDLIYTYLVKFTRWVACAFFITCVCKQTRAHNRHSPGQWIHATKAVFLKRISSRLWVWAQPWLSRRHYWFLEVKPKPCYRLLISSSTLQMAFILSYRRDRRNEGIHHTFNCHLTSYYGSLPAEAQECHKKKNKYHFIFPRRD